MGIQTDILATWMASGSQWPRAIRERRQVLASHRWHGDGVTHDYFGCLAPPRFTGCRKLAGSYLAGQRIAAWVSRYGKPDIAHAHWGLNWQSQRAIEVLSDLGVPVVLTEHSSMFFRDETQCSRVIAHYREAARSARVITAVSRSLALQMVSRTNISQIEVLANAIDPVFRPSEQESPVGKMKVMIVGTDPVKRPGLAIEGIRRFARDGHAVSVRVIGGGADVLARRIACAPGIDLLTAERLSPAELAAEFRTSDVVLCLSTHETFGCAPVEAAMSGCAVISTRVGVLGDILDRGCGLAVQPNAEAVAQALQEIGRGLDSWRSRRFEIAGIAHSMFGTEAIAGRLAQLYGSALQIGGSCGAHVG